MTGARGIVDGHLHVWSLDAATYPWQPVAGITPPTHDGSAELLLSEMAAARVEHACIVQPSAYGWDHTYVAETLRAYPGRFIGACLVDPLSGPAAPRRLAELVEQQGFQGLRLNPAAYAGGTWLDDPATDPLWRAAADLGVVVSLLIRPTQMRTAETMIARHPDVRVIIDHLGRPAVQEGAPYSSFQDTLRLARYPNTYVKVSGIPVVSQEAYPYRDVWPVIRLVLDAWGPQRLMWATDYPHIVRQCGYRPCLELVTRHIEFLSASDREWLLRGTAHSLWHF
ncbi:MAG: amidohydrolase [Chloroflexota bacterium]|nr:amidohydrolase [Chloroflexota bacterium]